jgi:hypothetical protein
VIKKPRFGGALLLQLSARDIRGLLPSLMLANLVAPLKPLLPIEFVTRTFS